jgi:hypothetical protein
MPNKISAAAAASTAPITDDDTMEKKLTREMTAYVAAQLMTRFRFSLREIGEIVSDNAQPVSYSTIRSWSTGKTLSIKPIMEARGFARSCWGLLDLQNFCLAKRMLRHSWLSAREVNLFVTRWASADFIPGVTFQQKMSGNFILAAGQEDSSKSEVFFYPKDSPQKLPKTTASSTIPAQSKRRPKTCDCNNVL